MSDDMVERDRALEGFNKPVCGCRKVPHGSRESAQKAADRLNATPDGWGRNYPFQCAEGRWHVGRPHKGKTVH